MRILITGGTGLVGAAAADALSERGHALRILSRDAGSERSTADVEYRSASVTDAAGLAGAAADCDVVLHIAGIVAETPPDFTFETVNVGGTNNVVREADASGVRRFIYLSSIGADTGNSDYHRSKVEGEVVARTFPRESVIIRLGNVYGPGDEVISTLVKTVRALPIIPVIDSGDQPFQPIWHGDVGEALAGIVEDAQAGVGTLNLVGPDVVTFHGLLDLLDEITGNHPRRIPLPAAVARVATRLASTVGVDLPLKPDVLQMIRDSDALQPGQDNALHAYVAHPTRIAEGMRLLLESMPEQDLDEGRGAPQHRRFFVRIENPRHGAMELFRMFCADYDAFLPARRAEQENNPRRVVEGETIVLAIPLRGDVSVRVEEARDNAVTLVPVDGHPLSGFVRLTFAPREKGLLFEINVYDRPARFIDKIGMALGGSRAQRSAWIGAAENVVERSGGTSPDGIQDETKELAENDVARLVEWLDQLRDSKSRS